jgi:ubiquinone/menaquinone biosynthesis C-methylase UbiE
MTQQPQITFDDGAAYERMMGDWSRRVGHVFLDWLQPDPGLRWLDVGCGNGAFSQLIFERSAPAHVSGIDPSAAQLDYARKRLAGSGAEFMTGDATALPSPDNSFDSAVMALVIFFLPEPEKGVGEMARVVRPGGLVSAYAWDILGGGLPIAAIHNELRAIGATMPLPPRPDAANADTLQELWRTAGLTAVETREITVERRFENFDDYWTINSTGPAAQFYASLSSEQTSKLKSRVRERLQFDPSGEVICTARANAIKGRVPG